MYAEALASIGMAQRLESGPTLRPMLQSNIEIHVDVGEAGPTREMIQELVGMIVAHGYAAKTKPESPGHTPPKSTEPPYTIDFPTFILSLASSVQISLGLIANPMTGKTEKDLMHAQQTIDILGMLETKTANNLTPEESGLLKHMLFQLRMQYVEVGKNKK